MNTFQNNFTYTEHDKTEAHMYYNASKGRVVKSEMICSTTSVSQKTRFWPLCNFYGLSNIIMNNAWIIFNSRPENSAIKKFEFLQLMAFHLCKPYAEQHYRERGSNLDHDLKTMMKKVLGVGGEAPLIS